MIELLFFLLDCSLLSAGLVDEEPFGFVGKTKTIPLADSGYNLQTVQKPNFNKGTVTIEGVLMHDVHDRDLYQHWHWNIMPVILMMREF